MLPRYYFLFFALCTTTFAISQSFQSFDNTTIAYTDEGKGTPIILIHGFINSGASFTGTIIKKQLLKKGYRVIIPDLRGNGDSSKPLTEFSYTNNAEVKDLTALLDHLKITKTLTLGYSRGSIVLSKWLTIESRISKAILGGMGLDFTDPDWERRIIFERAFLGLDSLTNVTRGAIDYAQTQKANLTILGWLQCHQSVTSKEELSKLTIPIAIIAGNDDQDNGDPIALFETLKNGTLIILKGDHNTTYRKEPFAQAVFKFLDN